MSIPPSICKFSCGNLLPSHYQGFIYTHISFPIGQVNSPNSICPISTSSFTQTLEIHRNLCRSNHTTMSGAALDMTLDDLIKNNKKPGGGRGRGRSSGSGPTRHFSNRSSNRSAPYSSSKIEVVKYVKTYP